jgi:hypothetical protein
MVRVREISAEEREWQRHVEEQVRDEWLSTDPVATSIRYAAFVSKSKGLRTSKKRGTYRRVRRCWKEVYLVKYDSGARNTPCHQWHRFPFDVYATELMGDIEDATEALKEKIPMVCGKR